MIGIQDVGIYIPTRIESNYDKVEKFSIDKVFIENKIGIRSISRKDENETSSDLCIKALANLQARVSINLDDVDFVCVCTQNPDYLIPQTSAILHGRLGLSQSCASFDISLGCSGWVYGVNISKSFMVANGYKKGLFFTSDSYSEIVSHEDKNTDLLFGDGAAVTLLSHDSVYEIGKASFGTYGCEYEALIKKNTEPLFMNGRSIFNFVLKHIPALVDECLERNQITLQEIDLCLFHQASKIILSSIEKKLKLEYGCMPFVAGDYGNTVSSSIPIALQSYIGEDTFRNIMTCGFGVGLSMAAITLKRINEKEDK